MSPRLIVEVRWGPMNGRKVAVDAGSSLRVGRTDRADLVIPDDKNLSGLHFTLAWDGERATLRDLGSQEGTLLDGADAQWFEGAADEYRVITSFAGASSIGIGVDSAADPITHLLYIQPVAP